MRFKVREVGAQNGLMRITGLSRGKVPLFLDGNLPNLKQPLEMKSFTVLTPKPGKKDPELLAEDLPHRIFVTHNPRDFVHSASLLDFWIIDTTHVSKDPNALVEMTARAWVDYSVKSEHPAFLFGAKA